MDYTDMGFGHFSTNETENDWHTRSYDGLESTTIIQVQDDE
jgi:hypothetical protein